MKFSLFYVLSALTSTTLKKGGLTSGDVGLKYAYKNALADVKVDTQSSISATFGFADIVPSTKTILSLKYPEHNSSKVEVQYFHPHGTFTTVVGLNQSPALNLSLTIGTPTIAFGGEASYDTISGVFSKYNAGFSLNKPDSCASIVVGDKGDSITASYVHCLDQFKKSSAVGEITRKFSTNENTFTVGGEYAFDSMTIVKAKLNNHGKLGAVLQHQVIPKSLLTISSELDTNVLDKTPRFGVSLALKP